MPFNTMPRRLSLIALAMLGALIPALPGQAAAAAPPPPAKALSASDIVKAAPGDWVAIAPQDLLVMALAPDAKGHPRQVVIQLIPAPFSQGWVGNLRKLAEAHWWDGLSVYRVQDNWVAQWGDGDNEDKAKARPCPQVWRRWMKGSMNSTDRSGKFATTIIASQAWNRWTGGANRSVSTLIFSRGSRPGRLWQGLAHGDECQDQLAHPLLRHRRRRARSLARHGSGAELYAVIGQPPRMLDRNIAVVGRVIEGIELSSLPRAPGNGVYKDAADRTPILSIRLASDLPAEQQPHFEYLSTQSASFTRYADLRAHRHDDFIKVAATSADICSIPMPIRRHPAS
jgi:peptidylprolyl isomerase